MKMATKKQAKLINDLTYRLYELSSDKDKNILIPFKEALEFPYDTAQRMIKDLKAKIKETEIEVFLKEPTGYAKRYIKFMPIQIIQNYKVIKKIRVDIENRTAEITTEDGQVIEIADPENKLLRKDRGYLYIHNLYDMLKQAIDHNIRVNIFKTDKYYIYHEDKKRDAELIEWIKVFNRILKATYGILPESPTYNKVNFKDTFQLIKERDEKLFRILSEMSDEKLDRFNELIYFAKKNYYGLAFEDQQVTRL
ncbi:MAG: hypothetical protein H0Z24_08690 [Thermosipho sp. (in: Bacteria)]|nr:hypothetical protein [Thermosipho sp. (in: thermotogales)]